MNDLLQTNVNIDNQYAANTREILFLSIFYKAKINRREQKRKEKWKENVKNNNIIKKKRNPYEAIYYPSSLFEWQCIHYFNEKLDVEQWHDYFA